MTLGEFRFVHSMLIEHYQFIEAHLEGIYAAISGKKFFDGLDDVDTFNINRILYEISKIEEQKSIRVFTAEEYSRMKKLVKRRNFWCHNCYYDLDFDAQTRGPENDEDVSTMLNDLNEAEKMREVLFNVKIDWMHKNRDVII